MSIFLAFRCDLHWLSGKKDGGNNTRIQRRNGLRQPGEFVAIFLSKLLGQGFNRERDSLTAGIQQADFLDIQLIGDKVGVSLHGMTFFRAGQSKGGLGQRLADFAIGFLAGIVPQRDQLHHQSHLAVEGFVNLGFIRLGPLCQVDRFGSFLIDRTDQVTVHFVGQEGHGRRQQFRQCHQCGIKRGVSGLFIGIRFWTSRNVGGSDAGTRWRVFQRRLRWAVLRRGHRMSHMPSSHHVTRVFSEENSHRSRSLPASRLLLESESEG